MMALRTLNRKIRMDILAMNGDICGLIFGTGRAQHACRLFLNNLKSHNGLTKAELSKFAWDLDCGKVEPGFKYSRRAFYFQVRHTLLILGLISIERRFADCDTVNLSPVRSRKKDIISKYVPVWQPINKRPPDGLNLVRLMWIICDKWNLEFLNRE